MCTDGPGACSRMQRVGACASALKPACNATTEVEKRHARSVGCPGVAGPVTPDAQACPVRFRPRWHTGSHRRSPGRCPGVRGHGRAPSSADDVVAGGGGHRAKRGRRPVEAGLSAALSDWQPRCRGAGHDRRVQWSGRVACPLARSRCRTASSRRHVRRQAVLADAALSPGADPQNALRAIQAWLNPLPADLSTLGGKAVVNVLQRAAPDKADAVLCLLERSASETLLFAGDDVNDEPVFERARPGWLTVRVGSPEAVSRAMYRLEAPAELEQVLDLVLQHLTVRSQG